MNRQRPKGIRRPNDFSGHPYWREVQEVRRRLDGEISRPEFRAASFFRNYTAAMDRLVTEIADSFSLRLGVSRKGLTLVAIIHSHCRVGAYFSDADRRLATAPGGAQPLFPGVAYLVLDAQERGVVGCKGWSWSPARADFVERWDSARRSPEETAR